MKKNKEGNKNNRVRNDKSAGVQVSSALAFPKNEDSKGLGLKSGQRNNPIQQN
jgi:hypothetical protein